jgi:hypothetical protein
VIRVDEPISEPKSGITSEKFRVFEYGFFLPGVLSKIPAIVDAFRVRSPPGREEPWDC